MKKFAEKFLDRFAKISVPLCVFIGIADTVIFVVRLYELYELYNLHLYQSSVVLIPPIVGMVLFYGMAILIPIVRKRQYYKRKQESE